MTEFLAYRGLDHVVILDQNLKVSSEDQNELRELLFRLRNGDVKL